MSKALKIAILEKDISQVEFARSLELSEAQLCRYVTGRSIPSAEVQAKIATILDKPAWILFPRGGSK